VSGEPVGQEGRLQAVRSAGDPQPRHQYKLDLLAADIRRIAEAAVPAAQRLPRSEGHAQLRGLQRENDARDQVIFVIDPQGIIRKKWIIENDATTVVYSDTLLRGIQEVIGTR